MNRLIEAMYHAFYIKKIFVHSIRQLFAYTACPISHGGQEKNKINASVRRKGPAINKVMIGAPQSRLGSITAVYYQDGHAAGPCSGNFCGISLRVALFFPMTRRGAGGGMFERVQGVMYLDSDKPSVHVNGYTDVSRISWHAAVSSRVGLKGMQGPNFQFFVGIARVPGDKEGILEDFVNPFLWMPDTSSVCQRYPLFRIFHNGLPESIIGDL